MGILESHRDDLLRRSQKRFEFSLPLEVYGKDVTGRVFTTGAILCNVSPDGGCLVLDRGIAHGQIMRISNSNGDVFPARVCWATFSYRTKQRHLGFKLEGGKNHWFFYDATGRNS
jgi:hypothetical protein